MPMDMADGGVNAWILWITLKNAICSTIHSANNDLHFHVIESCIVCIIGKTILVEIYCICFHVVKNSY